MTEAPDAIPEEPEGSLLERIGKTLILFASIALVTLIVFSIVAVTASGVAYEPYYSFTQLASSLAPFLGLAIAALVAGTIALVAAKVSG